MKTIIILGIILAALQVMLGMVIGGFIFVPEVVETLSPGKWIWLVIGIGGTIISMISFIQRIRDYCDYCNRDMEFSSEQYKLNKKIIITENDNKVKSDTIFFFEPIKK